MIRNGIIDFVENTNSYKYNFGLLNGFRNKQDTFFTLNFIYDALDILAKEDININGGVLKLY